MAPNSARKLSPPPVDDDDFCGDDSFVHLHGVTWDGYLQMLRIRGEHSAPRIAYDNGTLEIMSPGFNHEAIKSTVGCLIEMFCLDSEIPFTVAGAWTLKRKQHKKGLEPDECYVFGEKAGVQQARPDLAIEVIWTSGGLDKLGIYRALGVKEVWIWRRGKLVPYILREDCYRPVTRSRVLLGIDLVELAACVTEPCTSDAIKRFRKHCVRQRRAAAKKRRT